MDVSSTGGDYPVNTLVISGGEKGDRLVESPEVKVSGREASNSAGCSESELVAPKYGISRVPSYFYYGEGRVVGEGTGYKQPTDSPGSLRTTCREGLTAKARNHSRAA